MSFLATLATSGATGFIGTIASSAIGVWRANQEHKQNVELMGIENEQSLREINLEADRRADQTELEISGKQLELDGQKLALQGQQIEANSAELLGSYKHDSTELSWQGSKLLEVAEYIRRTFRPKVGYMLIIFCGFVYFTGEIAIQLIITEMLVTLTGTVIGWFFASREVNKRLS